MTTALPMLKVPGWPDPGERFKHVEVEINTACDLDCFACDRMSDVTTAPNMTVAQVRQFIQESLDLDWEWERIRFLGGEPTLHPHLPEIVEELLRYRRHFPKVFLQILTNGRGKSAHYRPWLEGLSISLHAEAKTKGETPEWFNNTRIVPIDRDQDLGEVPPCGIFGLRGCGIGLTRHGYFLDGAGATVARVAGYDIGIQRLRDVTWQAMLDQSRVLCRICGHWNPMDGQIRTEKVTSTGEVTGPFWTETLKAYNAKKPTMRIYGESP